MNLTRGTRNLLVALTVAGSALAAPAAALAETPAPDEPIGPDDVANPTENPDPDPDPGDPIGPDDVANPTENPDPDPCENPGDCIKNPTEKPDDDDDDDDDQDDHDTVHVPEAEVAEPVLATPTFTG